MAVRHARARGRREGYSAVSGSDAPDARGGGSAAAGFAELARLGAEASVAGVGLVGPGGTGRGAGNTSSDDDSSGSDDAEDEPRVFRAVDSGGAVDDL